MAHHWPKELLICHSTALSDSAVNYDYIITNNLLIGSRCIPSGAHTIYCWANSAHAFKTHQKPLTYAHTHTHTHKVRKNTCTVQVIVI